MVCGIPEGDEVERRTILILAAMGAALALSSGVALAANVMPCPGGYAKAPQATTR
jgi:hypothetical protein